MPDLPDRRDREKELAAAVLLVLRDHQPQWASGLSAAGFERDAQAAITPILSQAFRDSAGVTADSLNMAIGGISQAADGWAKTFAAGLAGGIGATVVKAFHGLDAVADRSELASAVIESKRWASMAVTNVTRAATAGGEYAASGWVVLRGILVQTTWQITPGNNCPFCLDLAGQPRDVWQSYAPGGPPAHHGCNCWLDYSPVERN